MFLGCLLRVQHPVRDPGASSLKPASHGNCESVYLQGAGFSLADYFTRASGKIVIRNNLIENCTKFYFCTIPFHEKLPESLSQQSA